MDQTFSQCLYCLLFIWLGCMCRSWGKMGDSLQSGLNSLGTIELKRII